MVKTPLTFNTADYWRVVTVVGTLPEDALLGAPSLGEVWRDQLEEHVSDKTVRFIALQPGDEPSEIKNGEAFDRWVDTRIGPREDRQKVVSIINPINISKWQSDGVLLYLLAEARPKNLIILIDDLPLTKINQHILTGIFANSPTFIFGRLDETQRKVLRDRTFLGEDPYSDVLMFLKPGQYAKYIKHPKDDTTTVKVSIYEKQQLISEVS